MVQLGRTAKIQKIILMHILKLEVRRYSVRWADVPSVDVYMCIFFSVFLQNKSWNILKN